VRALFFGTPAIAVPALEALASIAEIPFVICQPDRPAGRGLELRAPPVKVRAEALGLRVIQPQKIKTPAFAEEIAGAAADLALVIAYGRILPPAVLNGPRLGCLNLHASILPRYRGAAPITWAIVNGERETGISLMQMDEGMDTGAVFTRHAIPIGENTTAEGLTTLLGELAAKVVREDVPRIARGELTAEPQEHAAATMAPMLDKEHGRIDWSKPARAVHDHVRGMTPWPGAFSALGGKSFKVLETRVLGEHGVLGAPGEVIASDKWGIEIACGEGKLGLLRGQAEGRKPLAFAELAAGRVLVKGARLGA
jgi:methionyl-tRNA formyltransferase